MTVRESKLKFCIKEWWKGCSFRVCWVIFFLILMEICGSENKELYLKSWEHTHIYKQMKFKKLIRSSIKKVCRSIAIGKNLRNKLWSSWEGVTQIKTEEMIKSTTIFFPTKTNSVSPLSLSQLYHTTTKRDMYNKKGGNGISTGILINYILNL